MVIRVDHARPGWISTDFFASLSLKEALDKGNFLKVQNLIPAVLREQKSLNFVFNDGQTPLGLAVMQKNPQLVKLFLDNGADPLFNDQDNLTPIGRAQLLVENRWRWGHGEEEILQLLLENLIPDVQNWYKRLPESVIKGTLQHFMTKPELPIDPKDPLHFAAYHGDLAFLQSASIEALTTLNKAGFGPLHYALLGGHLDVLNFLLSQPNIVSFYRDNSSNALGLTPLHLALYTKQFECLELLLKHFDVSKGDSKGFTPLHYAIWTQKPEVIHQLIRKGASLKERSKEGVTPVDLILLSPRLANPLNTSFESSSLFAANLLCSLLQYGVNYATGTPLGTLLSYAVSLATGLQNAAKAGVVIENQQGVGSISSLAVILGAIAYAAVPQWAYPTERIYQSFKFVMEGVFTYHIAKKSWEETKKNHRFFSFSPLRAIASTAIGVGNTACALWGMRGLLDFALVSLPFSNLKRLSALERFTRANLDPQTPYDAAKLLNPTHDWATCFQDPKSCNAFIKGEYRKLALLLHPDKVEAEVSKVGFARLEKVKEILLPPSFQDRAKTLTSFARFTTLNPTTQEEHLWMIHPEYSSDHSPLEQQIGLIRGYNACLKELKDPANPEKGLDLEQVNRVLEKLRSIKNHFQIPSFNSIVSSLEPLERFTATVLEPTTKKEAQILLDPSFSWETCQRQWDFCQKHIVDTYNTLKKSFDDVSASDRLENIKNMLLS